MLKSQAGPIWVQDQGLGWNDERVDESLERFRPYKSRRRFESCAQSCDLLSTLNVL